MEKLTLTVEEMAKQLGISRPIAYDLTHTEGFPAIRIGRRVLVPVDGLKRWLDAQMAKSN